MPASAAAWSLPPIPLSALAFVGGGLSRPECILASRAGALYTADWRGGVAMTTADGAQTLYSARISEQRPLRPNGIALCRDGSFLLADLGETLGGVYALARDNTVRPFVERVDGVDLPPTNFVVEDQAGRVWITVSTRRVPRADAYRADVADGCVWITSIVSNRVVRVAPDGAQTVMLEDADAAHVQWCEDAYVAGGLGRPHLDRAAGTVLRNISSLAFGGADLRTAYLGCLLGDAIAHFRAPVAGHPTVHWMY